MHTLSDYFLLENKFSLDRPESEMIVRDKIVFPKQWAKSPKSRVRGLSLKFLLASSFGMWPKAVLS